MKRKRRHLTAKALKGEKSIEQIAQENDIAPSQVSTWKKDLEDHIGIMGIEALVPKPSTSIPAKGHAYTSCGQRCVTHC